MRYQILARLVIYATVVILMEVTGQVRRAVVPPSPNLVPPVLVPDPAPLPVPPDSGDDVDPVTHSGDDGGGIPAPGDPPPVTVVDPLVEISYTWTNHHDPNRPLCSISVRLPDSLIEGEIQSFGLSARHSLGAHSLLGGYRERGCLIERAENSLTRIWRADYRWMAEKSRESLDPFSAEIDRIANERGYSGRRDEIGLAASLVQAIPYEVPPDLRSDRKGEQFHTLGVKMPIETLRTRKGDCDSKSVLLAALDLVGNRRGDIVLIMTEGHAFVGIADQPRFGELYVTIQGRRFVLLETTASGPFGWISASDWQQIRHQEARVIRLD